MLKVFASCGFPTSAAAVIAVRQSSSSSRSSCCRSSSSYKHQLHPLRHHRWQPQETRRTHHNTHRYHSQYNCQVRRSHQTLRALVHATTCIRPPPRPLRGSGCTKDLSSFSRGHDITYESLTFQDDTLSVNVPKVILEGYGPSGFDVSNILKNKKQQNSTGEGDDNDRSSSSSSLESGTVHFKGSILAFPYGCFLWNVKRPTEITAESLAPVALYRDLLRKSYDSSSAGGEQRRQFQQQQLQQPLEYLFIGCNDDIPLERLEQIQKELTALLPKNLKQQQQKLVVEKLNLANAIGTFNILNAEDRQVAAALVLDESDLLDY